MRGLTASAFLVAGLPISRVSDSAIRRSPARGSTSRCATGRLPDDARWVRDHGRQSAAIRMMIRVPSSSGAGAGLADPDVAGRRRNMALPLLIPFVYFSHALNRYGAGTCCACTNLQTELRRRARPARDAHSGRISGATGHGRTRRLTPGQSAELVGLRPSDQAISGAKPSRGACCQASPTAPRKPNALQR